ncbi:magnesium transporter CorA family protein [Isobaculum melis]|uniref:Magnesium transporter n=1 Tax=Isobaculum melis TaxID=142588 RepID=A0A1H9SW76_9LACT|nr:magnesium transporter CorA family protein [Isobaculum melis]SER88649.1 magnesium transporter [Isobaculum melis]
MIQYFKTTEEAEIEQMTAYQKGCWINVSDPNEAEIQQLLTQFNMPRDYLTDVLDEDEVSRIEQYAREDKEATLVLIQYPHIVPSSAGYPMYDSFPLAIILLQDTILTVSKSKPHFIEEMMLGNVKMKFKTEAAAHFMARILWSISASYLKFLKIIDHETNKLEAQLKESTKNEQLFALLGLQKSLTHFSVALSSNHDVLAKVQQSQRFVEDPLLASEINDVLVENNQAIKTTKIYTQILSDLGTLFSSVVSNNLNIIMKVLTSLTIVLTIPTIIGGIYGMNVPIPNADRADAFWLVMALIFFLTGITVWILKRHDFF